jgi:CheY-like chemotaxis protein
LSTYILVVDDEPDVESMFRQHFRRDLRAGRFTMEFANSAPAALEQVKSNPDPSLILSDINMPDSLDGIAPTTLSERLRTLEKNGVVERRFYSMSPPRAEYVLTEKGRDLGPIMGAMRNWGRKYSS